MTDAPAEYWAFLASAAVVLETVESVAQGSQLDRPSLDEVRVAIAGALAAGWRLPDVEPISEEPLASRVSQAEWSNVFTGVARWVGKAEYYSTNQALRGHGTREVTTGSVADDLADIWRDLKNVLEAERHGTCWQEVVWDARFGLQTHWGKHAVEVLRALQGL